MQNKLSGWNDTIAALATPQGMGAIAVLRVSGRNAIDIVNNIFPSKDLSLQHTHTLHVGFLKHNDVILDEVVVSIFKSPHSYTGEDVVEISCHGSVYVQQKILQTLVELGARIAKPGEFTLRAFLNGKLDLAQAEAVADLIAGNTEMANRTAIQNMKGGFSNDLKQIREQLLQFSALIELELDFSQEDVEFADRKKLYQLLNHAKELVQQLLQSFILGNVIKNGVQVAIIGKPNVGKSTLLNTLLNDERAIVSEIAGTTRDTIEEMLNINGVLFRLIDTAGIRQHTINIIESIGVSKSKEKMRNADIVLYLFDVNEADQQSLAQSIEDLKMEKIKFILLGNKADYATINYETRYSIHDKIIFISAKENRNIDALKEQLFQEAIGSETLSKQTIVTNARHIEALQKVKESIDEIMEGLNENLPGDLLSTTIKQCLFYIGEITGEITTEEQLGYIFSKFCIGK
ncbi:MAG: tRNA uridine-5-carboxymethylaminomethyl(34) synthesis GTPase MnmE [Parafilimonas sp.]